MDRDAHHDIRPHRLVPIVVGADLDAERLDRPIAVRLAQAMAAPAAVLELEPIVVVDLWYLNQPAARVRPTIAIGPPERNAATAFFATRLPTAMVVEGHYRIHLDPEGITPHACAWGVTPEANAEAAETLARRFLTELLEAAAAIA